MEEGVLARALNYHWPPNSWGDITIRQLIRIYAVEHKMIEERERERPETAPPWNTGRDVADDDDDG